MVSLHHQKSIVVAHIYLEENVIVTRDTKWLQDKVCMLMSLQFVHQVHLS
jgi:hypothetical protein